VLLGEAFQLLEAFAGGVDVLADETLEALVGFAHLGRKGAETVGDSDHRFVGVMG